MKESEGESKNSDVRPMRTDGVDKRVYIYARQFNFKFNKSVRQ